MARKRPRYDDEGEDFREELKNNQNGDVFDEDDDDIDYGADYDVDDDDEEDDDEDDDIDVDDEVGLDVEESQDTSSRSQRESSSREKSQRSERDEAAQRGRGRRESKPAAARGGRGRQVRGKSEGADAPVRDEPGSESSRPNTPEISERPPDEPEAELPPEPEPEPEPVEPDNQDAIEALRDLGARVDINEQGRVWRIFLYEKSRDNVAAQIHGFPLLKEIWLLGSKVSPAMVQRLREAYPKVKIYV